MKKYLLFFISIIILASCGPKLEEEVEDTFADGSPRLVNYYQVVDGFREKVKVVAFYENGNTRYEGEFANGKRDGHWVYWYESGIKWSEGYFKNDLRDGFGTTWYENGRKHYQGNYKEGIRVGKWEFWDENGELMKAIDYDEED